MADEDVHDLRNKRCYACQRESDPEEGRCAFCDHRMCWVHTIRTTFYGEWISWCEPCYARDKTDREER